LRLKAEVDGENPKIDSVTHIWSGADWLEREVYDMFGIVFTGHPDLRRILMPEDYEPFPLRKDFDVRNREASKRSFERALREGDN
jgi:NADH:ubiquinone oxidoreductase subunit C